MVDDVLARLHEHDCRPRKQGAGWSARCPAHDDKTPSLSVSEGRTGGVVVHCHAGCTPERICQELGLTLTDLAPPRKQRDREIVATYDYQGANGKLAYQVVRFDPKDFRQRRPDGAGGWIWNMQDTDRVLYHLPQVMAAAAAGEAVWIAEGEKDADALIAAGAAATTNPGGAGKWRAEYAEQLRGARRIVIVADRDDPGRHHAHQVAAALHEIAADVHIVLPADGKDAADHLRRGYTIGDFRPLTNDDLTQPSPNGSDPELADLEHLDLQAILQAAPPTHSWVWDGYIERGTLVVLHGDGGTGKSLLGGHLARAISVGGPCLGRPTTQGRIVIIDAENKRDIIARRVHGLDYASAPPDTIHYYRAADAILGTTQQVDTGRLQTLIERHQPNVVILDSQRGLWSGEEKENLEIRALYRRLQAIAEDLDCAIILIHHDRRAGDFSGGGDIHNSADTRLWLERPDREKPERLLHHAKSRDSAELPKASYTFTFDEPLGLFTFTPPREPITDHDVVRQALGDEWMILEEIAERAGIRKIAVRPILWDMVRAGEAQYAEGPQGRSKRAKCWRKTHHSPNPSQTRDGSGRVAEILPSAHPSPAFTPPLGGEAGTGRQAEPVPPPDEYEPQPLIPDDDIPF